MSHQLLRSGTVKPYLSSWIVLLVTSESPLETLTLLLHLFVFITLLCLLLS
jgi:hypothetical protein